jgi:hypothetical protein
MPRRVVLTVPESATSYLRTHRGMNMTGSDLKWTSNTPSNEEAAKRAARELTSIVAQAEAQVSGKNNVGYGNFSQYLSFSIFPSRN